MTEHARLFAFEDDFVNTLRCVPMAVRFKLDLAGVKLSLRQWSRLRPEERRELLLSPCGRLEEIGPYRQRLADLIALRTGEAAKPLPPGSTVPWRTADRVPAAVEDFARSVGAEPPTREEWMRLTPLERFVLLKLSRDNHDNVNFIPALKEFSLYRGVGSPAAVA